MTKEEKELVLLTIPTIDANNEKLYLIKSNKNKDDE